MSNYIKLFGSILDSTVWKLPPAIKVVWVTMMAMADRDGVVEASLPGLADRAKVPLRIASKAVTIFLAPDQHSKTPDNEGRRIEVVNGGWRLINFEAYRERQSLDDRKTKNAERQQRFRDRQAARKTQERDTVTPVVTDSNAPLRSVTARDASCSAPLSGSDQALESDPRGNGHADLWPPYGWCRRYGVAWCSRYNRIAYGMAGDERASGALGDLLDRLPISERIAAQAEAPRMFTDYLARGGRDAERQHPFSFFVQEWGGLRVPPESRGDTRGAPRLPTTVDTRR